MAATEKTSASKPRKHDGIWAALAAFQADLPQVKKDGTNPHFKSRYATLADMTDAVFPRLAREGLVFTAMPTLYDDQFVLEYRLSHESGEKLTGMYPLPSGGSEQVKGSAITYARRYVLGAITGVAADDDDGNAASAAGVVSVAPPAGWRGLVAGAGTMEALMAVYERARAERWDSQDVLQVFTARKQKLLVGGGS